METLEKENYVLWGAFDRIAFKEVKGRSLGILLALQGESGAGNDQEEHDWALN